jgi:hypothetical protein
LEAEYFEQLQVLKFAWHKSVLDHAATNSLMVKDVLLEEFKELHLDDEMAIWDGAAGEVVAI